MCDVFFVQADSFLPTTVVMVAQSVLYIRSNF